MSWSSLDVADEAVDWVEARADMGAIYGVDTAVVSVSGVWSISAGCVHSHGSTVGGECGADCVAETSML